MMDDQGPTLMCSAANLHWPPISLSRDLPPSLLPRVTRAKLLRLCLPQPRRRSSSDNG
jgi:hypothetical protein